MWYAGPRCQGGHAYDWGMIGQVIDRVKACQIDILHAHDVKSDVITYMAGAIKTDGLD